METFFSLNLRSALVQEENSMISYLKGAAGADVKQGSLPVGALMPRLGPHHWVHRGDASDSQQNVERPCERQSDREKHKWLNTWDPHTWLTL